MIQIKRNMIFIPSTFLPLRIARAMHTNRSSSETVYETSSDAPNASYNIGQIPSNNTGYLLDETIDPWPSQIARPTMEEVRRARVEYFAPTTTNPTLQETLGEYFFDSSLPLVIFSESETEMNDFSSGGVIQEDVQNQVLRSVTSDQDYLGRVSQRYEEQALSDQDLARMQEITSSHRQRLVSNFRSGLGVYNPSLLWTDYNLAQRFSCSSIRVPPTLSRHELVLAIFFRLFSEDILNSLGIIVMTGTTSSFFVLYFFRVLFISVLNPTFFSQIYSFELPEVLLRSLRYVGNFSTRIYRGMPLSNSNSNSISMSWFGRILDFVRFGFTRFRSTFFNFHLTSFNALNSRLDDFQTTLAGFIRNARAGNYRSILYGVGINLLMVGFASLARSSFLADLLLPARDSVLRWVYASLISITGAAAGSPSSTSGTPSVPVPSLQSPVVVRDFEAEARRLLDALTEFFMYYF